MLDKTTKKIKRVAIFGDAEAKTKDRHFVDAYRTAKLLAENGYIILNGGGPGVMAASTFGAKQAGGKVELVILDPKKEPKNYEGIYQDNYVMADKVHTTENYPERLNKLIELADAFVIFKGGSGTLSEVGLTWELAKFEHGHHEPLIFVGESWREIVQKIVENLDFEDIERNVVTIAGGPQDVLKALRSCQQKNWWQTIKSKIKSVKRKS